MTKIPAVFQVEAFQAKLGLLKQLTAIFTSAFYEKQLYVIVQYIQQDATLHILFHLETALHASGGTSTHH